jgi:hypothetical protein
MKRYHAVASFVALTLLIGGISLAADDPIKSGPQVGENGRPAPFTPLHMNGPTPDEKQCLV